MRQLQFQGRPERSKKGRRRGAPKAASTLPSSQIVQAYRPTPFSLGGLTSATGAGAIRTLQLSTTTRSNISTVAFNGKHIQTFAGSPFDHLGAAIGRARMRRLQTVYNRQQGGISASTILLLTQTQFATFQTNATQGTLTGHAFTCGIRVDSNDDVDYLAAGTFDVGFNLLSRSNIDHLAGCNPGSTTRISEYQDTFLFTNAGIYELTAPQTLTKIGWRVTGVADKIGQPTGGFQQVDIYAHNSGAQAVINAITASRPLYIKSSRLAAQARDWYFVASHLFC